MKSGKMFGMIVCCVAYKGGVGKTALSVAAGAVAARETGQPVLLVDADPQGSAFTWSERAEEAGTPLPCATVSIPSTNLASRLAAMGTNRYALVVIDAPPGSGAIVSSALEVADVAILPTRPTTSDLDRLWPTWEAAEKAGTPALVVLNMVRLGTKSLDAARSALEAGGARVARTVIPQREEIAQAFGRVPTGFLATAAGEVLREALELVSEHD